MNNVYITGAGVFMPNEPVENDRIEAVLGQVGGKESRYRPLVLRANGIKQRYFALNEKGQQTHLNEELAANAVLQLIKNTKIDIGDIEMLATSTSVPDTLVPGFAAMVHGRLGGDVGAKPMEILSASGVCCASMAAFKAAYNAVRCGDHGNAVVVGSELISTSMKASRFTKESELEVERDGVAESYQYLNADFLRWMLSDGAGAVLLETQPRAGKLCLKVDWVRLRSYASDFPACMYLGTSNTHNLKVGDTYQSYSTLSEADAAGLFVLRQDVKVLPVGLKITVIDEIRRLKADGLLNADEVDHFLPHMSSKIFSQLIEDVCAEENMNVPKEKWFTNLETKGNTGAASIFIMLEEALNGGLFKAGDKIVTMVPESGRFSISFAHLTCVQA